MPQRSKRRMAVTAAALVAVALLSAATAPLCAANDADRSPADVQRAREARRGTPGYGAPRPPGSLLLNMLIKNEREHLDRTLPAWAKIIDAWIVGVDDANTDDSEEIIMKHLGHIPGRIVTVHFDGIGPTWTRLVDVGVREFPNVTHGIISDADFRPMVDTLDKMELDVRCSKHMYTIYTEDRSSERRIDWIYRNIPGAKVKRRTHQTVEVPPLPHAEVLQTLINLPIQEATGGYQDRTPGKNKRYIGFLEADLVDFPDDPRSLYYLGYAHYDEFRNSAQRSGGRADEEALASLEKGIEYFNRRVGVEGNEEELWFTLLKLGEIEERHRGNWRRALDYYMNCTRLDPERADAWFYAGQTHRLHHELKEAYPLLKKAATLPMPERSLFQWHTLYTCISKVEFGRLQQTRRDKLTTKKLKEAIKIVKSARCGGMAEASEAAQILSDLRAAKKARKEKRKREKEAKARRKRGGEDDEEDEEEEEDDDVADDRKTQRGKSETKKSSTGGSSDGDGGKKNTVERLPSSSREIVSALKPQVRAIKDLVRGVFPRLKAESGVYDKDGRRLSVGRALEVVWRDLQQFARAPPTGARCLDYRRASAPFLRFFRQYESDIVAAAEQDDDEAGDTLADAVAEMRKLCR